MHETAASSVPAQGQALRGESRAGTRSLKVLETGASSSALNQTHPNAHPRVDENPACEQHGRCASPEDLRSNDRKSRSDKDGCYRISRRRVGLEYWRTTTWFLSSQSPVKYSAEVTACLAYGEGHACLRWSPIILVYCIACIVFAQAVAWGGACGKCIAFLFPPSLADYLCWHLSINCTYCYTFFCRSCATRLCDEHILSI